MITLENVFTLEGKTTTLTIESEETKTIDCTGLTAFPGLIDPHVHFRTPGQEYKEDWRTAAMATVRGGYTRVFDMPNNVPACISRKRLHDKKALINSQLKDIGIPLKYGLYLGADKDHFDEIHKVKGEVVGVKIFMGSSTGDLLMDDESSLHAAFAVASKLDMLVAIHAEDEEMISERKKQYEGKTDHCTHSRIRTPEVAANAVKKVIELVKLYGTRVYILHVSSSNELDLIREAKKEGLPVYAETSPHHLFLNTDAYANLAGRAQMNPPLREKHHQEAVFKAIHDGTIDTIGSDHAPHTKEEKAKPYDQSPSGVPGIETNFPLLLNAYNQGLLSLEEISRLTCRNIESMFQLSPTQDIVLADLNLEKAVSEAELQTKCGWSPFEGWQLKGWPVLSVINGKVYELTSQTKLREASS